jgi:phage terminase large subunit-like protein
VPEPFRYTAAQKRVLAAAGGSARHLLLYGGSRSGKSFALCCILAVRALKSPGSRHAVIRRYFNAVRASIGLDTLPKALGLRFPGVAYRYHRSEGLFRFPNGSEIWLIGLDDETRAEKILGQEFSTIYFNECSELDYPSVLTALTRLAQRAPGLLNRAFYDCNPPGRGHWTYRLFVEKVDPAERRALISPENYLALQLNPGDNRENLPPGYIENTLANLPESRKQRFLRGEWSIDREGALWTLEMLARARESRAPEELTRIAVGVDPAVTSHGNSDRTGIVAAGIDRAGVMHVLRDASCRRPPLEWAAEAVKVYRELGADLVVGEVNNGGDLIESLLRQLAPEINYRPVRATRGKLLRAEPVAALYARDLVRHAGEFPELEEEMLSYTSADCADSPDRLDALVWVLSELARPVGGCITV